MTLGSEKQYSWAEYMVESLGEVVLPEVSGEGVSILHTWGKQPVLTAWRRWKSRQLAAQVKEPEEDEAMVYRYSAGCAGC